MAKILVNLANPSVQATTKRIKLTRLQVGLIAVIVMLLAGSAFASYVFINAVQNSQDQMLHKMDQVQITYAQLNGSAINPDDLTNEIHVNPGDVLYLVGDVISVGGFPRNLTAGSFIWNLKSAVNETCDLTVLDPDSSDSCSHSLDFQPTADGVTLTVPASIGEAATIVLTSNVSSTIDYSDPTNPMANSAVVKLRNDSYSPGLQVKVASVYVDGVVGDPANIYLKPGQVLDLNAQLNTQAIDPVSGQTVSQVAVDGNGNPSFQVSDFVWTMDNSDIACDMSAPVGDSSTCPAQSGLVATSFGPRFFATDDMPEAFTILVSSQNPLAQSSTGVKSIDTIVIHKYHPPLQVSANLVHIVSVNSDYNPTHADELEVEPGSNVNLMADLLDPNRGFAPISASDEDFVWQGYNGSDSGATIDVCDASLLSDCFLSSNFRTTDYGVSYQVPWDIGEYITIRVRSLNPTASPGSYDRIILHNRFYHPQMPYVAPVSVVIDPTQYSYPSFSNQLALAGQGQWVTIHDVSYFRPNKFTIGDGEDWTPYRNGYWSWVEGDGLTWVSYDPWGWLTDHYGVWRLSETYGWVWLPFTERHYVPHAVSFFYDDEYVGWFPYDGEDPGLYRQGANDVYHDGFNDGYWDGYRSAINFGRPGFHHNPGLTVIHQTNQFNAITNINVADVCERMTMRTDDGGVVINENVLLAIDNASNRQSISGRLGGRNNQDTREFLRGRIPPGSNLPTTRVNVQITATGDRVNYVAAVNPVPDIYVHVAQQFGLSKNQTPSVGSVLRVAQDGQGRVTSQRVEPSSNGKSPAPAPRINDTKSQIVQSVVTSKSKNLSQPEPANPEVQTAQAFRKPNRQQPPQTVTAQGAVTQLPTFKPDQIPPGAITARPAPGKPAVANQLPPLSNKPAAPPLPQDVQAAAKAAQMANQAAQDAKAQALAKAQAVAKMQAAAKAQSDANAALAAQKKQQQDQASASKADKLKQAALDQAASESAVKALADAQSALTAKTQNQLKLQAQSLSTDATLSHLMSERDALAKILAGKAQALANAQSALKVLLAQTKVGGVDLSQLQAQVVQRQNDLASAQAQAKVISDQILDLSSKVQQAQTQVSALNTQLSSAQATLAIAQKAASGGSPDPVKAKAQADAQAKVDQLNQQLKDVGAKVSALSSQVKSATDHQTQLASQVGAAQATLDQAQKTASSGVPDPALQRTVQQKQAELDQANAALSSVNKQIADMAAQLAQAQQKQAQAGDRLNSAKAALDQSKTPSGPAKLDPALQQNVQQKQSALEQITAQANSANQQLANQQNQVKQVQMRVTSTQAQVAAAQNALASAQKAASGPTAQQNQVLSEKQTALNQMNQQLASAQAQLKAAEAGVAPMQQAEAQKAQAAATAQQNFNQANSAFTQANAHQTDLQNHLNTAKSDVSKAQTAVDIAQKAASAKPADAALKKNLDDAKTNLSKTQSAQTAAQTDVDNGAKAISVQSQKLGDLRQAMSAANSEQQAAASALSAAQGKLTGAQSSVAALSNQQRSAQAEVTAAQSAIEQAKQEAGKSIAAIAVAQSSLTQAQAAKTAADQELVLAQGQVSIQQKTIAQLSEQQTSAQAALLAAQKQLKDAASQPAQPDAGAIAAAQRAFDQAGIDKKSADQVVSAAQAQLDTNKQALTQVALKVQVASAALTQAKEASSQASTQSGAQAVASAQQALNQAKSAKAGVDQQVLQLQAQLASSQQLTPSLTGQLVAATQALQVATADVKRSAQPSADAKSAVQAAQSHFDDLSRQRDTANQALIRLQAQAGAAKSDTRTAQQVQAAAVALTNAQSALAAGKAKANLTAAQQAQLSATQQAAQTAQSEYDLANKNLSDKQAQVAVATTAASSAKALSAKASADVAQASVDVRARAAAVQAAQVKAAQSKAQANS